MQPFHSAAAAGSADATGEQSDVPAELAAAPPEDSSIPGDSVEEEADERVASGSAEEELRPQSEPEPEPDLTEESATELAERASDGSERSDGTEESGAGEETPEQATDEQEDVLGAAGGDGIPESDQTSAITSVAGTSSPSSSPTVPLAGDVPTVSSTATTGASSAAESTGESEATSPPVTATSTVGTSTAEELTQAPASTSTTAATATPAQVDSTENAHASSGSGGTDSDSSLHDDLRPPGASATTSASSSPPAGSLTSAASSSASTTASATTTPTRESDPEPLSVTVESANAFSFSKNECTRIADGSFYCQAVTGTTTAENRLEALRDRQGDLEIYLTRDGERTQLTDNRVDDASPHYDPRSNTIVWHRLVDDRYQIVSLDLESGEEEQLTDSAVNDMEPARYGDRTVWQRWVGDNWEIMLRDGDVLTQLTESPGHDIDPQIRGDLVIWNGRTTGGEHQLMVYDVTTDAITAIADGEGVSVGNPRFVMMYEAMYENGDVVTKGYDLETGEIVPLHSLPRELPDELPESDSTGETRALIQNKPAVKDPTPEEADPEGDDEAASGDGDAHTLDLRSASSSAQQASSSPATTEPGDLVINPATSTASGTSAQ